MSDESRRQELERLAGALPPPAARAEFRGRVRERFLAGAAAAPPVDVMPDERPRAAQRSSARNWKPWIALAAAAAVVAVLWISKPAPRHWRVLAGSSATIVRVNGDAFPAGESERIAEALNDARSVSAEGGSLRLAYRDFYAFELPQGARVEFAAQGNTGGVDPLRLAAEGESLRVVTGPGFPGHELFVRSADANLRISGTAFSIDASSAGVCVCGLQGHIALSRKNEKETALEAGKQCWFPKDGGALTWGTAHPEHVEPVRALQAAAAASWQP